MVNVFSLKIRTGGITLDALGIIIFLFIFLWSITKTLEKATNKILEKQNIQNELLIEIKTKLASQEK